MCVAHHCLTVIDTGTRLNMDEKVLLGEESMFTSARTEGAIGLTRTGSIDLEGVTWPLPTLHHGE